MCIRRQPLRKEKIRSFALLIIITLAVMTLSALTLTAAVDKSKIYYGNPEKFKSPAEIKLQQVLSVIPEYQKVKKDNLTPSDAAYWILMKKANKKFKAALKSVADKFGYDLIGEIGSIKIDAPVPDITIEVIIELKSQEKG